MSAFQQPAMNFQTPFQFAPVKTEMPFSPAASDYAPGQTVIPLMKKSKQDYSNELCAICQSKADGLHYGAVSCRSCNAFFRRAVTFKQKFVCRKGGQCDLRSVRCACRACRYSSCLRSGMKAEAVQPKRDPTGAQKNRRPPKRRTMSSEEHSPLSNPVEQFSPSILPSVDSMTVISGGRASPASPYISVCSPSPSSIGVPDDGYPNSIRVSVPSGSYDESYLDDVEEFESLVRNYHEHLKMMNRAMLSIDDFLSEQDKLAGLMYWLEKLNPFKSLKAKEREVFFKMYSVRKLSLDHFYQASKTGFETLMDDEKTKKAKLEIIRPTIDRLWHTVVLPFMNLGITDAEIVTLHILLLWSTNNNRHVSKDTRELMRKRREWAIERLFEHYEQMDIPDPVVRLGEILLLLPEIEVVCDLHCKDFQVSQLFEFCNMSEYWYEKVCYTALSIT
ncbi:ligand-binding domain of nuclear hormone receptor domain-containing protein [Ditylenchus destructor]|nr:ligand-binding domain of nuclear hormone receptor domain-containing protein [Ditylenchus destructor]